MALSAERYVIKNKTALLKLYSAFYSGIELDLFIQDGVNETDLKKKACLLACLSHKNSDESLNFSIDKEMLVTKTDEYMRDELYSVVLCEEQVKIGKLSREGDFYLTSSADEFKSIPRYKKYIRVK